MKNESVIMFIISFFMVAVLIVPLPPVIVKILYLLNFIFASVIVGTGFFSGIRKSVPKIYSTMILLFTVFTLIMFTNTTRFVLLCEPGVQNLVMISRVINSVFSGHPIRGYLLTAFVLIAEIVIVQTIKIKEDEKLNNIILFMRGTVKAELIIFAATVIASCFIGVQKLNVNFAEAFKIYFPYCCSQILLYMFPLLPVSLTLNLLQLGDFDNSSNN